MGQVTYSMEEIDAKIGAAIGSIDLSALMPKSGGTFTGAVAFNGNSNTDPVVRFRSPFAAESYIDYTNRFVGETVSPAQETLMNASGIQLNSSGKVRWSTSGYGWDTSYVSIGQSNSGITTNDNRSGYAYTFAVNKSGVTVFSLYANNDYENSIAMMANVQSATSIGLNKLLIGQQAAGIALSTTRGSAGNNMGLRWGDTYNGIYDAGIDSPAAGLIRVHNTLGGGANLTANGFTATNTGTGSTENLILAGLFRIARDYGSPLMSYGTNHYWDANTYRLAQASQFGWATVGSAQAAFSAAFDSPSAGTVRLSADGLGGGAANLAVTGTGTFADLYLPNGHALYANDLGGTPQRMFFLDTANNYGARNEGGWGNAYYGCTSSGNADGAIFFQTPGAPGTVALIIARSGGAAFSGALSAASLTTTGNVISKPPVSAPTLANGQTANWFDETANTFIIDWRESTGVLRRATIPHD